MPDGEEEEGLLEAEVPGEAEALAAAGLAEGIPPGAELVAGLVTGAGRPGDRFPGWFCQHFVLGVIFEAIDYEAVRANAYRSGLILPDWGRTPLSPERFVRFNDEFWMMPIVWLDRQTAWKIVGDPGKEKLEPRPILHPRWVEDLPGDRRWTLWAKYGPLHEALTAEGRAALRCQFPNFHIRPDYDYTLIDDPWDPSANELFWAMNPELKGQDAVSMSREEFRRTTTEERTEWAYMNGPLQDAWCDYLALLVSGGAFEDPRSWNPYKTSVDFHANERFCTEFNFIVNVELDDCGIPIYKGTGNYYEPKLLEEPQKPRLQKLITSPNKAVRRYLETKGYGRLDFDPRPDRYRDLWGRYYPEPDPEREIVSDPARMAETIHHLTREIEVDAEGNKTLLTKILTVLHLRRESRGEVIEETLEIEGPTHSAVDLVAEMPAESWVKIGKFLRHNKLRFRHWRLYNVGRESGTILEADVGHWMMTWVPVIHQHGLNDAELYLPFQDFWMGLMDADKGIINGFVWSEYPFDEFRKLIRHTPLPNPLEQLSRRLVYWKFDPEHCWYGWDHEGKPRLPVALLGRLVRNPAEGGMNLVCPDGRTILTTYREGQVGDEAIRNFWKLSADEWNALPVERKDYCTIGYAYYRPIERPGDYHKGLLSELWRNQPAEPLEARFRRELREKEEMGFWQLRDTIYKQFAGLPILEPDGRINDLVALLRELLRLADGKTDDLVALLAHGKDGSSRGFSFATATGLVMDGYGQGYMSPEQAQEYIHGLYEIALKCRFYDTIRGAVEAAHFDPAIKKDPQKLMGLITTPMLSRGINFDYGLVLAQMLHEIAGKFTTLPLPHPIEAAAQKDKLEKDFVDEELKRLLFANRINRITEHKLLEGRWIEMPSGLHVPTP